MKSNEPSQQDIIEAQLHLLLAGRDHLDVTRALQNVLHKHYKQIAVISLEETKSMESNLFEAHNLLIAVLDYLDGRTRSYSGQSVWDMTKQMRDMVFKSKENLTYARNTLAHSTYPARKYANDGGPVFTV